MYFRKNFGRIYNKVLLQVRRTPRRQTGEFKTNRASRWKLPSSHPDYTAAKNIPLIEAKLLAYLLEFAGAPNVDAPISAAVMSVLGRKPVSGSYRCPVSGRLMSFSEMKHEASNPTPGVSSFHVGHVKPRAKRGANDPDNVYWTTSLGNRIQGDKTLHETEKTIVEMAESLRIKNGNITWGEMTNRYLD
jgi:hypothetical protein